MTGVPGAAALGALFPQAARSRPAAAGRRAGVVAAHAAALAAGTAAMLARIPGRPAWDTIYNEDLAVYLVDALARPWHLFIPYGGYLQLMPRLVAQAAALLPLRLAAGVFALAGALTAAACAVVVFHASAGHLRAPALRVLAGASVVLLPIGSLEIADSTVNASWYLLLALFWASLWRPRGRTGMTVAAATAFLAASAQPLALLFVPLFAARIAVLRRPRDHAVTIGWAAGLLAQVPVILASEAAHHTRAGRRAPAGQALAFYGHAVVRSALGWHAGWWLRSAAGPAGAVAITGGVLAALFAWALVAGPASARMLIAAALLTGFAVTVISADVGYRYAGIGKGLSVGHEAGSRYATLAVFLIDCAVIAAVAAITARYFRGARTRRIVPVLILVPVLAAGWATDFRFATTRSAATPWGEYLARWEHRCGGDPAGVIRVTPWDMPRDESEAISCAMVTGSAPRAYEVKCQYSGRNVYIGSQVTPCRLLLTASMK